MFGDIQRDVKDYHIRIFGVKQLLILKMLHVNLWQPELGVPRNKRGLDNLTSAGFKIYHDVQ
jgi:hypothetical protein